MGGLGGEGEWMDEGEEGGWGLGGGEGEERGGRGG